MFLKIHGGNNLPLNLLEPRKVEVILEIQLQILEPWPFKNIAATLVSTDQNKL